MSISGISILIPIISNSNIEFLEDSLKSVINQSYKNWELIISSYNNFTIDDIISKINIENIYDIRHIYIKSDNKAYALNTMKSYIKYDHIALLENGTIWDVDKLELQIPFISLYDVVGTNYEYLGDNLNNISKKNIPVNNLSDYNFFIANPIINSSVILKARDAIWDENEKLEDYDLWFKLYISKKSFYNISQLLCKCRIYKDNHYNDDTNNLKTKWFNYINNLHIL